MSDLIRDAPIGQIIRFLTKNRLLKYPEELDTWRCPHSYDENAATTEKMKANMHDEATREHVAEPHEPTIKEKAEPSEEIESPQEEVADFSSSDGEDVETTAMEKIATHREDDHGHLEHIKTVRTTTGIERVGTRSALTQSKTRGELEEAFRLSTLDQGPSRPVIPATLDDGTILVDWYTTDDPAYTSPASFKVVGQVHANQLPQESSKLELKEKTFRNSPDLSLYDGCLHGKLHLYALDPWSYAKVRCWSSIGVDGLVYVCPCLWTGPDALQPAVRTPLDRPQPAVHDNVRHLRDSAGTNSSSG